MHEFQKDFLLEGTQSDKLHHHGYHRIYPWFLGHLRNQHVRLLEVGIHETESLKLWAGYFQSLTLHGIDIDAKEFDQSNVILHKVDQSKSSELDDFVEKIGADFDIIVDDGSHVPAHQILTLNKLWKVLKPGGVYIIEDIETSYWGKSSVYGYKFNSNKMSTIKKSMKFIDFINAEFNNKKSKNDYTQDINNEIEMISFSYNCVILIKKDFTSFANYYDRNYRFANKVNERSLLNYLKRITSKIRRIFSKF